MSEDQSPGRGAGSGRLWTEPREDEEHTAWLAQRPKVVAPPADEPVPAAGPAQRSMLPFVALGTLIAVVLFAVGVLADSVLRGDDSSGGVAALPAAPGAAAPDARSRAIRQIYASASPSVVLVRTSDGAGTGFVIDRNGTIVTNAHVVEGSSSVQVRFDDKASGVEARVLGSDPSSDLAVLRVDPSKTAHVRPLALANSDSVRVGDLAVAIGYPLFLDRTATAGIVSGVGRDIQAPNGFSIDKVIQTDAAINKGNSGGPLLDAAGRVIGINSQIVNPDGGTGNVGIAFAVPSNTIRQVVPRLRSGATIRRAYLGISSSPITIGLVVGVVSGGPAAQAGVQVGDVVTRVNGKAIQSADDISAAIQDRAPGDDVEIDVRRNGVKKSLGVKLGTRPQSSGYPSAVGP